MWLSSAGHDSVTSNYQQDFANCRHKWVNRENPARSLRTPPSGRRPLPRVLDRLQIERRAWRMALRVVEPRGFDPLTFSLRRSDTRANELLRRLLVGAWRGVEWVSVRVGGTPGVRATTASMPSTVDLCGGPTLRLAVGHPRPPLTATLRGDW